MDYILDFLPEVEDDTLNAYDWYEEQSVGLGESFLLSVEAVLNSIQRRPKSFSVVYKGVRKLKTKRFPFGVFFHVDGVTITVIAIVHLARHPKTWKRRV